MHAIFERIRIKLSIFILVLLICITIVFSLITTEIMNQSLQNEIIKRAESLSRSSAVVAAHSLLSRDVLGLDNIAFKGKNAQQDIEYFTIVDRKMKAIVHSDVHKRGEKIKRMEGKVLRTGTDGTMVKESPGPSSTFEVETPILFRNKVLGAVIVGVNKSVLWEAQRLARHRILWGFFITLLLGVVGIFGLSVFVTRPIQELSLGVNEFKQGKRTRSLKVYSRDELGKLTESFNEMTGLITDQQEKLARYTRELEEAYVSTVRVLAAAIDARDPYTHGHSTRVAAASLLLGQEIGLSQDELEELEICCFFHDVGKLGTPDAILHKNQNLNSAEYREIRRHPEDGADILGRAKSLQKYILPVRHHHECYDGTGYPDGLGGDTIPLFAAIIAIADAFDAMTSSRPYRKGLPAEEALRELANGAGKQFHPALVQAFIRARDKNGGGALRPYLPKVL
jgi:HD-GYP domain-containing protein (c-di-GMP phosphodiesterase class II)